jgi:hypothetical protein
VPAESPQTAVPRILELVKTKIPERFGLDPIRDIQVLCPMNRGGAGARALNIELQAVLNPVAGERRVERFGWTFSPGDKGMQIENDYDKEVYNGDIGYIADVYPEDNELTASFDGRAVTYAFDELDSRLCRDHSQKPGLGISGRSHSGHGATLSLAKEKSALYRRHPRQNAGCSGRTEEGDCHRASQSGGAPALVQAPRMGRPN